MYKYIKAYKMGYNEGIKDSFKDFLNNKNKKFKYIKDYDILSKLYDIGYINAYNYNSKYVSSLKKNKYIV